jgi:hypothetical protein
MQNIKHIRLQITLASITESFGLKGRHHCNRYLVSQQSRYWL